MIEPTARGVLPQVPLTNQQRLEAWLVRFTLHVRCLHARHHHTTH